MTPTLIGRLQTRLFAVILVGVPWSLLLGPVLPGTGDAPLGDVYATMLLVVALVALVGLVWECLYHALQQLRWEKDWPTLFGLLQGIPEGVVLFPIAGAVAGALDVPSPTAVPYVWHFATTWFLIWAFLGGPMRVVSLRWRFFGGRLA